MSEGYTYTTLSGGPDKPMNVTVSFYLDDLAWMRVVGADTGRPLLCISHGEVSVNVGPAAPGLVTAEDARIARSLADLAAEYASEVERLSTATAAGAGA
jgi:hypothetical protein